MKYLTRSNDQSLCIETIEEAKKYFTVTDVDLLADSDVIKFNSEVAAAESLEEIADIWGKWTDRLEDGSQLIVKEI